MDQLLKYRVIGKKSNLRKFINHTKDRGLTWDRLSHHNTVLLYQFTSLEFYGIRKGVTPMNDINVLEVFRRLPSVPVSLR